MMDALGCGNSGWCGPVTNPKFVAGNTLSKLLFKNTGSLGSGDEAYVSRCVRICALEYQTITI